MVSLGKRLVRDTLKNARYMGSATEKMGTTRTSMIFKTRAEAEEWVKQAKKHGTYYDVRVVPLMETPEGNWQRFDDY